ncbi:MAG: YgaP-like transmembrane domain [Candidatus Falkowbacteria bacterium]
MFKNNEGVLDRLIRVALAEIFFILALFWFGGVTQIILYVLSLMMVVTAGIGFCGLYKIFSFSTNKNEKKLSRIVMAVFAIIFLVIAVGGVYASSFFSKKFFIEDFNSMNNNYKQTLYYTGQDNRAESTANYEKLVSSFSVFKNKYNTYKPVAIRSDLKFNFDLEKVSQLIANSKDEIYNGDLKTLHYKLESIRLSFQEILKRNNFSMLGMALSDFHDAMEVAAEAADSKKPDLVISAYPEIDTRLKAVEEMANDSEIQGIRASLETLVTSAKNNKLDDLPKQGADLKSSFIKVYLKRG